MWNGDEPEAEYYVRKGNNAFYGAPKGTGDRNEIERKIYFSASRFLAVIWLGN